MSISTIDGFLPELRAWLFTVTRAVTFASRVNVTSPYQLAAEPLSVLASGSHNQHVVIGVTSWSNHVKSWTQQPHGGLHVVRYEDMQATAQKTFSATARFLGLSPPRERLKRAIKFSSFKALRQQEDRHGFGERSPHAEHFFRVGRSGQWRQALSPAQVDAVVAANAEQMERFGYLP